MNLPRRDERTGVSGERKLKKFSLLPNNIISRLMVIILAVVIVSGGAITGITSLFNAIDSYEKLGKSANGVMGIAIVTLAYPLWNIDLKQVEEVARALLQDANIIAVNVHERDRLFLAVWKDESGSLVTDRDVDFKIGATDTNYHSLRADINFKDEPLGSVEIVYTDIFVASAVFTWTGTLILGTILLVFLITQAIYFSMKRFFVKPILSLVQSVQEISRSHDYSIALAIPRDDEIGTLYANINEMLSTILTSQEELAKTKTLLQGVIDSMPSMLIAVNEKNEILLWNRETENATLIKNQEIIGKRVEDASNTIADLAFYLDLFSNNHVPAYFFRRRLNEQDPKLRDVSIFPLYGDGIAGAVIRVDDVTDSVSKERQLEQAQKMETIGTLAGGLAHDFNNVLAGVLGSASLIKMEIESEPEKPIKEITDLVQAIEFSGKRASGIVQQLLTLARRTEPDIKCIDLNEIINNVIKICQNTFDKSIEIAVERGEGQALAEGDAAQLEQVLLNLCVNASHAMTIMRTEGQNPGGKLTVNLQARVPTEIIRSRCSTQTDSYWQLSISDTGVGMDEKTMLKIFDPFFTTKDKGTGTGLGLAIVYSIIKQHGGFVDIKSEVGKGSTFNVILPAFSGKLQKESPTSSATPYIMGTGTILIIDDELLVRTTARVYLGKCGFTVIEAENGADGVDRYARDFASISLVILDMVMPKVSGREAFFEIKRINPQVKIVISSGFKKDERVQELLDSGAQGFLNKPYTVNELSKCVSTVLGLPIKGADNCPD